MPTYVLNISFAFLILCLLSTKTFENEESDGMMTLSLEHSLDLDSEAQFVPRGTISIKSIRSGVATFNPDPEPLTLDERRKLKELAKNDGLYRIRATTRLANEDPHFVSTFMRACSLVESLLSDVITVHFDQNTDILGISTKSHSVCEGIDIPDSQLTNFNTTVLINQMENGPVPDTASYIQKVEKEKAEKAKGEQSENRSFLAKYWMYIIPVFIFLLISGAANPEGQAAGGR